MEFKESFACQSCGTPTHTGCEYRIIIPVCTCLKCGKEYFAKSGEELPENLNEWAAEIKSAPCQKALSDEEPQLPRLPKA